MKRLKKINKAIIALIILLTTATVLNFNEVEAAETTVSVQPSSQTVGQEDVPLPTSPFTINITVQDVEDLYTWQIVLYYNSTILNTRTDLIIIPTENIFKGKNLVKSGPYIENDSKGTYIIFGATLYLDPLGVTVTEPGVLCQINFTGQATGTSELNLGITTQHGLYTYLLDSNEEEIVSPIVSPSSIVDGIVTVLGPVPPVADFTYSPLNPIVDEDVTFDASASTPNGGTIVSYEWNFGDGNTGAEKIITHAYTTYGTFTVTLTITDSGGLTDIESKPITIRAPPVASFDYSPELPEVLVTVTFDASASYDPDGTIVSYAWDFGDSNTGSGVTTTHAYLYEGTYTVKLTVVDDNGLSSITEKTVAVGRGTIEIEADVGTIHFAGIEERAEFYLLVKFLGEPIDVTSLSAKLYYNGTIVSNFPTKVERVDTGLYRILWDPIPDNASSGTYTVLIQASYFTLKDSTIKSFLISDTLTSWNDVWLDEITGNLATIVIPNLGQIKADLTQIKATLVRIEGTVGIINSTVGQMKTDLTTINAKVVAIDGNVATIKTDVGTVKTSGVPTIPLYATAVFSAVAAIIALIVLFILRRRKPT